MLTIGELNLDKRYIIFFVLSLFLELFCDLEFISKCFLKRKKEIWYDCGVMVHGENKVELQTSKINVMREDLSRKVI